MIQRYSTKINRYYKQLNPSIRNVPLSSLDIVLATLGGLGFISFECLRFARDKLFGFAPKYEINIQYQQMSVTCRYH